jgi:transcriptional regulator with GAF, ATPase, and Fis domain
VSEEITYSTDADEQAGEGQRQAAATRVALVICHAGAEAAERLGEVCLLPPRGWVTLGRGGLADAGAVFVRQRPGINEPAGPLLGKRLSREQLRLSLAPSGEVLAENIGRCPMLVGGEERSSARLSPGDTLCLRKELLLLVTRRPLLLPPLSSFPAGQRPPFGAADPHGLVGESPAIWALREQIAFSAHRNFHILLLGESGTGKELVARAIHRLSARSTGPFVARNAATLPPGLVDAELFGNAKNYPNAGMPERLGLVGEADGGTLFLDEIGELPEELQVHLLRVLDRGGEHQRLGEARPRTSDLRFVGATNRGLERLKHDLLARFTLRLKLPPLEARREDIPMLAQHLLREGSEDDPDIRRRFAEPGPTARFRLSQPLIEQLLAHPYRTHVRELSMLLWQAIAESSGDTVEAPSAAAAPPEEPLPQLNREAIEACLARNGGVIERSWRELGLKNRFVLMRLVKKLGIATG